MNCLRFVSYWRTILVTVVHVRIASKTVRRVAGSYFVGVDGGGTKTRAVLVGPSGRELARATGGPANFRAVGRAVAERSLREVIARVIADAQVDVAEVAGVGLGIAGAARPDGREMVHEIVERIAPFPRVVVTHDAEAALVGGAGRRYGVVLIAGTGAMAYGVNSRGDSRRADGWGYLLGDEGSGYWIGHMGLRAVVRACDWRGEPTRLVELLGPDPDELVVRVYGDFGVPQVAAIAPMVVRAAEEGDAVARDILRQAGERLSESLKAVVRGLGMAGEVFPVVLCGGVLRSGGIVRATVVAKLRQIAPRASAMDPLHDAAFGAAMLAVG